MQQFAAVGGPGLPDISSFITQNSYFEHRPTLNFINSLVMSQFLDILASSVLWRDIRFAGLGITPPYMHTLIRNSTHHGKCQIRLMSHV
jgi:hypothetical protein